MASRPSQAQNPTPTSCHMKINDSRQLFAPGSITLPDCPPIIVADGLRTPENVGALIRLAANVGSTKVIIVGSDDMRENKIRRTACMAWDYVSLIRTEAANLPELIPSDYSIVAIETAPDATSLYATPLPRKVALLVGSEVHGVSPEVLSMCHECRYIPMTGPDTSMNVSQAAAVALFEWVRCFASAI